VDVLIGPLDVATATEHDLHACHALTVAAFSVDRPDAPPPTYDALVSRLRVPVTHLADQSVRLARRDGHLVGLALIQTPEGDNEHLSIVELRVDPRWRRHGVGSALLRDLLPRLRDRGRSRILGEGVTVGGDGDGWSRAMEFTEVNRFVLQTLPVTDANRDRWRVVPVAAGYRLRRWIGHAPDDLLASYARARGAMVDAPAGSTTIRVPEWSTGAVRATEQMYRQRGVERRVVVAVEDSGYTVVGLTEVDIYPSQPELAIQADTSVVREHRGHGLGLSMKAAMATWLTTERTDVAEIGTNVAADNPHMIRINHEIGYVTTRIMMDVEADLAALLDRLEA
jgi:mycothiol synthase